MEAALKISLPTYSWKDGKEYCKPILYDVENDIRGKSIKEWTEGAKTFEDRCAIFNADNAKHIVIGLSYEDLVKKLEGLGIIQVVDEN